MLQKLGRIFKWHMRSATATNKSHKSLLPSKDSPGYQIYHVWYSWQEIKNIQCMLGSGTFYIHRKVLHVVLRGKSSSLYLSSTLLHAMHCPPHLIYSPNNLLEIGIAIIPVSQINKLRLTELAPKPRLSDSEAWAEPLAPSCTCPFKMQR